MRSQPPHAPPFNPPPPNEDPQGLPAGTDRPGKGGDAHRVFNFTAGPATLPLPVLEQIQREFLDYQGLGAGIIEISHRSREFMGLVEETTAALVALMNIPPDYRVLYTHGGGQMQFSLVALNLLGLKPAHKALYVETGSFAARAALEAGRLGYVRTVASSESTGYDRIPEMTPDLLDAEASYLHITTNNTAYGTRWQTFPDTGALPLVGDLTSEILSRKVDVSRFGLIYAGAQKNLAPPGLAVVIVRDDLIGHALPKTPLLLDLAELRKDNSLTNTLNTFAVYVMRLMLDWLKNEGGVEVIERRNEEKVGLVYAVLDEEGFYKAHAHPGHRSTQNVTFDLADGKLLRPFIDKALEEGLYGLAGHPQVGGIRASMYNAMPLQGAKALADFMREFRRKFG